MRRLLSTFALALAVVTPPALAEGPSYGGYRFSWASGAPQYVSPRTQAERAAIAAYGPFRVIDARTAALVGTTDSRTPRAFERMLRDFPRIATLRMVECPGTRDDRANLALGRQIRAAGLAVTVPAGGSVRSGAVELALAGTSLTIDDRAQFAVHAWRDDEGYGASDYPADSPEHRKYLAYYREMGMGAEQAATFYAMTNATPFQSARWLTGAEMRRWVGRTAPVPAKPATVLAAAQTAPAAAPAAPPAVVYAPATVFLAAVPVPIPVFEPAAAPAPAAEPAPRLPYLDLQLTLF